jgi:serpin B
MRQGHGAIAVVAAVTIVGYWAGDGIPPVAERSEVRLDEHREGGGAAMCDDDGQPDERALARRVASIETRFGLALAARLAADQPDANLILSPVSIATALAAIANGAGGETRRAIAEALRLRGLELSEVNRGHAALRTLREKKGPGAELILANALWERPDARFGRDFETINRQSYGAELATADFADPGASQAIDAWVRRATGGKIERAVSGALDPDTALLLVSAAYFKGAWARPFDRSETRDAAFTPARGAAVRVPMMHQAGRFRYLERAGRFAAVALPYRGGRYSMYVFLPDRMSGISRFCAGLDADDWSRWLGEFAERDGEVSLPRFRDSRGSELSGVLGKMGMGAAFDPGRADFGPMLAGSSRRVFVKRVEHRAYVAVDESGTEAAGATAVEVVPEGVAREPFRFVADRPFVWAILEEDTRELAFIGVVATLP